MEEIWKDIPEYEGYYQVSNLGRIRSLDRVVYNRGLGHNCFLKGRVLKHSDNGRGYKTIWLKACGNNCHFYIHRLVAQVFVLNNKNKPQVNHIDGDKSNNAATNLEWCSCKENMSHAHKIGLYPSREELHVSTLTEDDVRKILSIKNMYHKDIAIMFGVQREAITKIKNGKRWPNIYMEFFNN